MATCPATNRPCIDDPCYGAGCLRPGGGPMLVRCPGCGRLVAIDGTDDEACECEPGDEGRCEEDDD